MFSKFHLVLYCFEFKKFDNTVKHWCLCLQKDGEDNLVYADLDLAEYPDLAAKRPLVTMNEQTEYVSIDFSKTGAAIIDNDGDKN